MTRGCLRCIPTKLEPSVCIRLGYGGGGVVRFASAYLLKGSNSVQITHPDARAYLIAYRAKESHISPEIVDEVADKETIKRRLNH